MGFRVAQSPDGWLLKEHTDCGLDGRRTDGNCKGSGGFAGDGVYAGFRTSSAIPIARPGLCEGAKSRVVINDDDRACGKRVLTEVNAARVQDVVLSLLYHDGDDEVVVVVASVVFVERKHLTAVGAGVAIGIAGAERLRESWLTNDDSTGRDGRTVGTVRILVGETGPLIVAATIHRGQNAKT